MGTSCSKSDTTTSSTDENVIVIKREALLKSPSLTKEDLDHWHVWNQLDMHDEATATRVSKFMHNLIDLVVADGTLRDSDLPNPGDLDLAHVELHDKIHLDWPLDANQVSDMTHDFESEADDVHIPLPRALFHKLITSCSDNYANKPNVVMLHIPPDCKLTVVGDLHGQLQDLLYIFKTQGLPSPTNWYLFNGDLIDRGTCSLEICAILFAYQHLFPMAIHMNRGNHEDSTMNSIHSFRREVYIKYDAATYEAFNDLFARLPLAHVINDAVFVVHGGLSATDLTLDQINTIPRRDYHLHVANDDSKPKELHWMQDLLWSDPQMPLGQAYSRRGAGILFGPDVCASFLQRNNLKLVIRSHESVRQGFMWPYDYDEVTTQGDVPIAPPAEIPMSLDALPEQMLVTIFSCSNYCHETNYGAYMVLDDALHFNIHTYQVPSAAKAHKGLPTFRSVEDHNRRNIIELIVLHKPKLMQAFASLENPTPHLATVDQWATVLRHVLALELDWTALAPAIATVDADGFINTTAFLQQYRAAYEDTHSPHRGVFNALYPHRKELEVIFCFLDRDHSGSITLPEFKRGCLMLNQHLPTSERWKDPMTLFHDIDLDGAASINVNKFFEAFRIVENRTQQSSS
ncbi:Aste57867_22205 [Aphanomyces stellatus]|uniref:Serine/threonine-protein phosphatase n=1 Tax=Aphanomyces stellatus TaxID=120398 RepID=A0A485LJR5_9STRA|nr:hypothetical protein As57867_022136 [Aphanomyces stellatus]VFT98872.1 Aste57867_22205 [Aphanomyces stellatus]